MITQFINKKKGIDMGICFTKQELKGVLEY
jgi:hypothetical protein